MPLHRILISFSNFLILVFLFTSKEIKSQIRSINQYQNQQLVWDSKILNGKSIQFLGKYFNDVYSLNTDSTGLVFKGGSRIQCSSDFILQKPASNQVFEETWHDSPVVQVRGKGTEVYYSGAWHGDNNYSKPILNLSDHGRFIFGKNSSLQLIFPAYGNFTRQLWVRSDGTGILELEKGFIADRSEGGKKCEGTGCFRLMNCTLISHDSASLPAYYRPEPKDKSVSHINSHLVFERGPFSRWWVKTQKQNFIGGLWLYDDLELRTDKHLKMIGRYAHWSDYTNYGGLIFCGMGKTLRKTGADTLTLECHTAVPPGSRIVVEEGVLQINANPFYPEMDTIKGLSKVPFPNGRFLQIEVRNGAGIILNSPSIEIQSLKLQGPSSTLKLVRACRLKTDYFLGEGKLELPEKAGTFEIETPELISGMRFVHPPSLPVLFNHSKETNLWTLKR
jgi:hypothetical protein